MKNILPVFALLLVITFPSCKKMGVLKSQTKGLTSELVVPKGFSWENSRNIKVKVFVTDQSSGSSPYLIALYDHDPALGERSLAKGSATLKRAFETAVYLSKQISTLYIVKTSANNARVISKVALGSSTIEVSMGAPAMVPSTGINRLHPGIKG